MQRRKFVKTGIVGVAMLSLMPSLVADKLFAAEADPFKELYDSITKGKTVESGKIKLTVPEEPEKAEKTPVEIEVSYPMTENDYIAKIYVLTPGNKVRKAIVANFTPKSGIAYLSTDVRIGTTQELTILAETNKGKIFKATKTVKATVSGCGA